MYALKLSVIQIYGDTRQIQKLATLTLYGDQDPALKCRGWNFMRTLLNGMSRFCEVSNPRPKHMNPASLCSIIHFCCPTNQPCRKVSTYCASVHLLLFPSWSATTDGAYYIRTAWPFTTPCPGFLRVIAGDVGAWGFKNQMFRLTLCMQRLYELWSWQRGNCSSHCYWTPLIFRGKAYMPV